MQPKRPGNFISRNLHDEVSLTTPVQNPCCTLATLLVLSRLPHFEMDELKSIPIEALLDNDDDQYVAITMLLGRQARLVASFLFPKH